MSKLNKYAAAEICGELPKGVTAIATLTIELKAKCTACGETQTFQEEIDGRYNAEYALKNKLKFTSVFLNRDKRSMYSAEFLLCPSCNKIVQDWMSGATTELVKETK